MATVYEFPKAKSSTLAAGELASTIREITPAIKTIAEEAHRRAVIRTCRNIARNDRRARLNRENPAWRQ